MKSTLKRCAILPVAVLALLVCLDRAEAQRPRPGGGQIGNPRPPVNNGGQVGFSGGQVGNPMPPVNNNGGQIGMGGPPVNNGGGQLGFQGQPPVNNGGGQIGNPMPPN